MFGGGIARIPERSAYDAEKQAGKQITKKVIHGLHWKDEIPDVGWIPEVTVTPQSRNDEAAPRPQLKCEWRFEAPLAKHH